MKTIVNKKEVELEYKEKAHSVRENKWYLGDTPFDGHFTLWSFSYEPTNYLKESYLSGDEYRKGGTVKFFMNNEQVFEFFCRTPERAIQVISEYLPKLQSFNFSMLKKGQKIWYQKTPAIIDYVMLNQGSFTVKPDGVDAFPDDPWNTEDWMNYEDPTNVKVDIFDSNIWWYRD